MAGQPGVVPSRNELDDEDDFGFRFGQLNINMDDERFVPPYGFSPGPSYAAVPRPPYPSYTSQPSLASSTPQQQHSPYIPHQMPLQNQHQHQHQHQLQAQSPFIPYQHWASPPMSPSASFGRVRHGSMVDDMGAMSRGGSWIHQQPLQQPHRVYGQQQQQGYSNFQSPGVPPSAWTSPSAPSYQFFTPQHAYQPQFDGPMQIPSTQQPKFRANRMSWSGPSRQLPLDGDKDRERKPYHPLPPAKRSDWVMWVGNVPQNTSHEELWRYFNSTIPTGDEPWKGPSSIFLISRSSCAFVNLSSQEDLDRAVSFFNGRQLRSWDARCPRMVCRVRRKDDDLRSGVGAQRGTGMHREWIKSTGPVSPAALEHPPEGEGRRRESIVDAKQPIDGQTDGIDADLLAKHKSTNSYASTNSSFLIRHFPKRVFILKSMTLGELEDSVHTGTWRTQRHNEPILDQAYRTAPEVYLIFGANKTGEFFGYAKMVEPIDKEKAAARAKANGLPPSGADAVQSPGSASVSERPQMLSPSSSTSTIPMASPGQLTPMTEEPPGGESRSFVDLVPHGRASDGENSIASAPADLRPVTLDPVLLRGSGMAAPIAAIRAAEGYDSSQGAGARAPVKSSSDKPAKMDDQGVKRKDTIETPPPAPAPAPADAPEEEEPEHLEDAEGRGHTFRIEWLRVAPVPFGRTRHLRNPWNADREVKVSRDGTEVEPNIGSMLMAEWERM